MSTSEPETLRTMMNRRPGLDGLSVTSGVPVPTTLMLLILRSFAQKLVIRTLESVSTYVHVPLTWAFVCCEPSPPVIVSPRMTTLPGPGFEMSLTKIVLLPLLIVSPWTLSVFVTVS